MASAPCYDALLVLLYYFIEMNVTVIHSCIKWVPGDASTTFGNQFSRKMQEDLDSMCFSIFLWENMYHNFTWGPNAEPSLQCDASLWRNLYMFWTRLLDFSSFLVKQYISLIYVKEKPFHKLIGYFLLRVPGDSLWKCGKYL